MARTVDEIDRRIDEWEALRADYASRGSTGIVDFINAELRKLHAERAACLLPPLPKPPA